MPAIPLLGSRGLEIRRWPHPKSIEGHLQRLLRAYQIDLVLDVGGNEGQFGQELRRIGYDGWIVSFEPGSGALAKLRRRAARDPRWLVEGYALGDAPGESVLNIPKASDLASFYQPSAYSHQTFGESAQIVARETVPVQPLYRVFGSVARAAGFDLLTAPPRVFLKMDTQGNDLRVFVGAESMLSFVQIVQTEGAVKRVNEGTPLLSDVAPVIERHGFTHAGLHIVSTDPKTGDPIEYDALFARGDA